MPIVVQIQSKLLWKYGQTKQGSYVAVCDAISQTVQARRFSELLETMSEALDSTFRELFSTGDLETFLRERGWSTDIPVPPNKGRVRFEIPFELKGSQRRDREEMLC
jgi:hypothetical protein